MLARDGLLTVVHSPVSKVLRSPQTAVGHGGARAGDEIRKCNRRTREPCGVHMCISSLHWSPAVAAAALASSRTRRLRWERTDRLHCTLEMGPDEGGGGVEEGAKRKEVSSERKRCDPGAEFSRLRAHFPTSSWLSVTERRAAVPFEREFSFRDRV